MTGINSKARLRSLKIFSHGASGPEGYEDGVIEGLRQAMKSFMIDQFNSFKSLAKSFCLSTSSIDTEAAGR